MLTDDKPPSRLQTFMAPTMALTSDPMAEAKRELAKVHFLKLIVTAVAGGMCC